MSDKITAINDACDKLVAGMNRLGRNMEVISRGDAGQGNPFLASAIDAVERLRDETTKCVEKALVEIAEHEKVKEENRRLVDECKVLEDLASRMRRDQSVARATSVALAGQKRWQDVPDSVAGQTQGTFSPPRQRPFRLTSIEEELGGYDDLDETTSNFDTISFRGAFQREARLRRYEMARQATRTVDKGWREEDDSDAVSRVLWLTNHSKFDEDWSAEARTSWATQMSSFVENKSLEEVIPYIDHYVVGDKRTTPPEPRGCFFARVKKNKGSPGGEMAARPDCEFCKIVVGDRWEKRNRARCHCTALFVEGIPSPYPNRAANGEIPQGSVYNRVAPYFNEDGHRWVWSSHELMSQRVVFGEV